MLILLPAPGPFLAWGALTDRMTEAGLLVEEDGAMKGLGLVWSEPLLDKRLRCLEYNHVQVFYLHVYLW